VSALFYRKNKAFVIDIIFYNISFSGQKTRFSAFTVKKNDNPGIFTA